MTTSQAGGTTGRAKDDVQHPYHYNTHPSGLECIDLIEMLPMNLAMVVKYSWRHRQKGSPEQDLQKASFYARREAERYNGNPESYEHLFDTAVRFYGKRDLGAKFTLVSELSTDSCLRGVAYLCSEVINCNLTLERFFFHLCEHLACTPEKVTP